MAQSPYGTESPQEAPHRTTVLENFSFAQVIASALAAVTSVLLSQQIGVIGGMLGTAAGAAAATIAIQLYRGILDVSAERIREQITPVASGLTTRMAPQPTAEETVELKGAHLGDQPTEVMPSPAPAPSPEPVSLYTRSSASAILRLLDIFRYCFSSSSSSPSKRAARSISSISNARNAISRSLACSSS